MQVSNRAHFSLLLLAAGVAACQGDTRTTPDTVQIEDSSGVRIVKYAGAPDTEAPLHFAPEAVYRYGAGPGDYMFTSISRGVLLGDGSAAVFDVENGEVVLVGADGRSGSVLAREGEGPGEVGSLAAMFGLGQDSLLIDDGLNSRFTLFVGDSLANTSRLPPELRPAFRARGLDENGRILMSSSGYHPFFPEDWLPGYLVRLDLASGVADTVATYDFVARISPDGTPRNPWPYFGLVGTVRGEFLYARSDTPELVWRFSDGSIRQIVRWNPATVYPADEHWELFANDLAETAHEYNPGRDRTELMQDLLAAYHIEPDMHLPLFGTPMGDDVGRVWLGDFTVVPGTAAPSYTIFSSDGLWLGRVAVPDGLQVLDVAGGRVLGVERDEMDVQSVVVYEITGSG